MDSKINKCNVVPSTSIEEILKKLHSFTEEHMEKQPLFTKIEDDLKHFDDNVSIQQSIMQYKVSTVWLVLYFKCVFLFLFLFL